MKPLTSVPGILGVDFSLSPRQPFCHVLVCDPDVVLSPALSRNSSGSHSARGPSLVVFSPLVHTPALRGIEDGEGRQ